uniref:Craniofacial development protein 1 n=1 Tax=Clastoptera arizonana TaxID=38151 RepID=A0A1B6DZ81_9HEMI
MDTPQDFPSSSDESDIDYVPSDNEDIPSEEDSDNYVEEDVNNETKTDTQKSNKRKKKVNHRGRHKILKPEKKFKDKEIKQEETIDPVEEKKKADLLWNDFMKDCGSTVPKTAMSLNQKESIDESVKSKTATNEKENKVKVTDIFDFAGEKVCVEKDFEPKSVKIGLGSGHKKEVSCQRGRGRGRGGNIASILNQIGKKGKLSTLEKSKLDWERFKVDEGIKEDIEKHNKGKNGYLERQDFLERSDHRQFEIEKKLRTTHRSSR